MCQDARARGIKGSIQWISCMHVCGRECNRMGVSESEEERLIGVLVLCRGRDAREAEIISLVELNLNGATVRDPQFCSFYFGSRS